MIISNVARVRAILPRLPSPFTAEQVFAVLFVQDQENQLSDAQIKRALRSLPVKWSPQGYRKRGRRTPAK